MAINKICGIYIITSPSGKVYVGQSKDILKRFYRYQVYNCDRQPYLFNSLKKYSSGAHKYEIVYEFPLDVHRKIMDQYEQFFIYQYKEAGFVLLNMNEGGKTNKELADSTRKKLSESAKGKKYWLGRKHSDETKEKIRQGNTGKVFSEERLRKMSEGNKGKPSSMKGKKHTDEARAKLSAKMKGRKYSQERLVKTRGIAYKFGGKGERSGHAKLTWEKVREIRRLFKEEMYSCKEIAEKYEVTVGNIRCIVNNITWIE